MPSVTKQNTPILIPFRITYDLLKAAQESEVRKVQTVVTIMTRLTCLATWQQPDLNLICARLLIKSRHGESMMLHAV